MYIFIILCIFIYKSVCEESTRKSANDAEQGAMHAMVHIYYMNIYLFRVYGSGFRVYGYVLVWPDKKQTITAKAVRDAYQNSPLHVCERRGKRDQERTAHHDEV